MKSILIVVVWMLAIPMLVVVGATDAFQKPALKAFLHLPRSSPQRRRRYEPSPRILLSNRVATAVRWRPRNWPGEWRWSQKQCAICHGDRGDGAGKFAYLMNPRPRNFKQGEFKLTTTPNLIPSDDDLLRTISRGTPGSAMPPWGHLPPSDSRALVAFLRTTHADAVRQEIEAGVKDGSFEEAEVFALLAKGYPDPPRSFVSGIFKAAWTDALPSLTQPFPFVASSHS